MTWFPILHRFKTYIDCFVYRYLCFFFSLQNGRNKISKQNYEDIYLVYHNYILFVQVIEESQNPNQSFYVEVDYNNINTVTKYNK